MNGLAGLNRWEQYWCRRAAYSPWSRVDWVSELMMLAMLGASGWAIAVRSWDADGVGMGFVAGVALTALLVRNVPIRSERVIGRLTRALDGRDPGRNPS